MINILLIAIVALLIIIATATVANMLSQGNLELKELWYTFLGVLIAGGILTGLTYWALNFFNIIY